MKRKRGHKKGRPKGASAASAKVEIPSEADVNVENDSGADEFVKDDKYDSGMEVDTPSSTGTDQPHNVANINPDGSIGKGIGKPIGRVKVKLKTSKMMESQVTSSDAPTQSDTDKSSQHMDLERQSMVNEKMEDSANSLPEAKMDAPESSSMKAGSIKIKSSKLLGSSSNQSIEAALTKDESPRQREEKMPRQDPRYDKHELDTALMVIKKVMKMDAAEPFNVPVNPVALGIPDYFDVIDTPMDFGTICNNLESGVKYENSEDVFKDVQYIWDNCFKYNNKGDYILDLMRRVKKNFTKYWTAAGLYGGQPRATNGVESSQEKVTPSGQIKVYVKGGQKKPGRKFGRRHKSDCLCAICVLKRRRREREENARIANSQTEAGENNLPQELKQEESSPAESPSGDNSSSNMDESLVDPNTDAEVEQSKGVKMEESKQHSHPLADKEEDEGEKGEKEGGDGKNEGKDVEMKDKGTGETPEQFDKSKEDTNKESIQPLAEKSGDGVQSDTQKEDIAMQHEEGVQPQKQKETRVKACQIKIFENPMLLELCGTLFPDNDCKSIWTGPHSLVRRQTTSRTSSIHAAIDMLMK